MNHDESGLRGLRGLSDLVGPLKPPSDETIADALAFVTRHAIDAADRDALAAALGIEVAA